jgi:acyl-CoA thioesterase
MALPEFDRDAAIERIGDGVFRAGAPESWRTADGRPQGGYVAAQVLMGMMETVGDPAMHPRSITAHLVRSPGLGDYEIRCSIERRGRTITNVSARCFQDGKLQTVAIAVFGTDRHGPEFDELPMPDIAPPTSDRSREAFAPEYAYPFIGRITAQPRLGGLPFANPEGPMHNAGWLGFTDPRPFDAPGLMVLCDAGMMPFWIRLDDVVTTATVDYTMHFRTDFPRSYPLEMGVIENRTRLVKDGHMDWDITMWGPDGEVLCIARQGVITLAR